jgi:hypothetical protein
MWTPISEKMPPNHIQVICCHKEHKWIRFGRIYPEMGNRWYYSGTNERSQYAQTIGDEPTHWMHMMELPN